MDNSNPSDPNSKVFKDVVDSNQVMPDITSRPIVSTPQRGVVDPMVSPPGTEIQSQPNIVINGQSSPVFSAVQPSPSPAADQQNQPIATKAGKKLTAKKVMTIFLVVVLIVAIALIAIKLKKQ